MQQKCKLFCLVKYQQKFEYVWYREKSTVANYTFNYNKMFHVQYSAKQYSTNSVGWKLKSRREKKMLCAAFCTTLGMPSQAKPCHSMRCDVKMNFCEKRLNTTRTEEKKLLYAFMYIFERKTLLTKVIQAGLTMVIYKPK